MNQTSQDPGAKSGLDSISIPTLRRWLSVALAMAVLAYTAGVFLLVQQIFNNFGPGVHADLEWRTVHGAQQLARAAELGLAVADSAVVLESFGDFRSSEDVIAIVATSPSGGVVAQHGLPPAGSLSAVFALKPDELHQTPEYFASWSPVSIEGAEVGRVAMFVSTRRLTGSQRLLKRVELVTAGSGGIGLVLGLVVLGFFTGAVIKRDAALAHYAATLEDKVAQRTQELNHRNRSMRLVLDNVSQGFITIKPSGVMESERSAVVERWLGPPPLSGDLAEWLERADDEAGSWFRIGVEAVRDGILPLEVSVDQLPKRMQSDGRTFRLDYIPITSTGALDEPLQNLLVVITDITDELARERFEREQREMAQMFQLVSADRPGFMRFFSEAEKIIHQLMNDHDHPPQVQKRLIHTLKGNCGLYRLVSMVEVCHQIESRMEDDRTPLTDAEREVIRKAWTRVAAQARSLIGDETDDAMEIDREDYTEIVTLVAERAAHERLAATLRTWKLEPVSLRLRRLGAQARYLAERLGKPAVQIVMTARGVRLDSERFDGFWSSLAHVVRNAVDHGIETPDVRRAGGKADAGTLALAARIEEATFVLQITDDGAGINWTRLAEKAAAQGLPHATHADLVEALFADGVSTKEEVTQISGRGVGMAAVRSAVLAMGGRVLVNSEPGQGTSFEFRLPAHVPQLQKERAA